MYCYDSSYFIGSQNTQFTCISTNTHIPMLENGNAVLFYRTHAAVDARRIVVRFLNVWRNRIMCPIRLQVVVVVVVVTVVR